LPQSDQIAKVEVAGPGFINFFCSAAAYHAEVRRVLAEARNYGRNDSGAQRKMLIEFVSANPTGPLHVGHGRAAAVGDCLARLFTATGWSITREFYYNDAGAQIANLALSVQARCNGIEPDAPEWPADGYRGEYIKDVAQAYLAGESVHADGHEVRASGDVADLDAIRHFAVAWLRRETLASWLQAVPALRAGLAGALAATLVGTVVNDSGALLLEIGAVYLGAFVGYAWAESNPPGAARDIDYP